MIYKERDQPARTRQPPGRDLRTPAPSVFLCNIGTKLDRALTLAGMENFFEATKEKLSGALQGNVSDQHARAILNMAKALTELADLSVSVLDNEHDNAHEPRQDLVAALQALRRDGVELVSSAVKAEKAGSLTWQ